MFELGRATGEAQQRGSLHAHILCWFKRRHRPRHWQALPSVPKASLGATDKQRPHDQAVRKLDADEFQEDSIYQLADIARVAGEMPRPDVSSTSVPWGGYDYDSLRVAGLARSVLIRLGYCHVCSPNYCLLNRSTCRFFFPWPHQPYQVSKAAASSWRVVAAISSCGRRRTPSSRVVVVAKRPWYTTRTPSALLSDDVWYPTTNGSCRTICA